MKVLMVTPMVPHPNAVNAGPLVMHAQLAGLAARHDVVLATLAGPDPGDRDALTYLRRSGINVKAVWRPKPSTWIRRWRGLARFAGPDPNESLAVDRRSMSVIDNDTTWFPQSSLTRRWKRRIGVASGWLYGACPMRGLQFWEPEMQHLLDHVLAINSFDMIQVDDNAMGNYRYRTQTPTVLTEHEVRVSRVGNEDRSKSSRVQKFFYNGEQRRWLGYQRAVWGRFDRIQVFTPRDAAAIGEIAPYCASRVRINPFGVDAPVTAGPSKEDSNTIAFVGGFYHPPNVEAALWLGNEIMPLLRCYRPGTRLIIVGSYPTKEIQALATNNIIVTGRVPAVEPFLEKAAVVLVPVRSGGGMRLKVLQAMAMSKAVVTTRLGAEGLDVPGCELPVMIAEDAKEIARATATLLAAEDNRRALGQRARIFVRKHFSWPAYQQRLEEIYAELQPARSVKERHALPG